MIKISQIYFSIIADVTTEIIFEYKLIDNN